MRWCLDRWRGRAALLTILCLFAAPAAAGLDDPKKPETTKEEPKNPKIEEAGQLLLQGKVDEAYALLQQAYTEKKDLPPPRLMEVRLVTRIREYQPRVRALMEQAVHENTDHPLVYIDNAGFALGEGRVTDAILNAEKALALSQASRWSAEQKKDIDTQSHQVMASAYEARADWDHARAQLSTLLAKDAQNPQYHFRLARAIFFSDPTKKEQEAYTELKAAAAADRAAAKVTGTEKAPPPLDTPDVAMAKFWATRGDIPNARKYFDQAVKTDPGKERVLIAYADWLMQQNEIATAKNFIVAAAKAKPGDTEVQKFQGLVDRIQKNYADAERVFKQIVAVSPEDSFSRNQLALVLADETGDEAHRQAKAHAELNVQASNQKSPEAWATLGYVLYKLNNVDTALQVLQQAVQTAQGQVTPDTGYYLALCLKEKGQNENARKILKEALSPSTKGLFVYKQEATELFNKLEKLPATTTPAAGGK